MLFLWPSIQELCLHFWLFLFVDTGTATTIGVACIVLAANAVPKKGSAAPAVVNLTMVEKVRNVIHS